MNADLASTNQAAQRELTRTILFSDVVGSTHVIEEQGDRAWRQLIQHHTRTADQLARTHNGTVVGFTGDGVMAAFLTPVDGVACALRLRLAFKIQASVGVRLGLHHGSVSPLDGYYIGLTANIASRLTDLADAGELVMSDVCYQQARSSLALPLLSPNAVELRGVSAKVAICTVSDNVMAWA